MIKIFVKFFLVVILIYIVFVISESYRIKNSGKDPLFIIGDSKECQADFDKHVENSFKTSCKGLGYKIEREYALGGSTENVEKGYSLVKEEFWVFNKFLIWAWIS